MHTIARFVGLDLRSMRPKAQYLIIPVVMIAAPVLLLFGPYLLIPALSGLAASNAPPYLFGNDDRGRLDTLYTALGIRRGQVVAGRYATCLLLLMALTLTGDLLAPVAALATGTAFNWAIAAALTAGSVALTGICLAAQLPAFFGTSPGPVRVVAAVPPVVVLVAVLLGWALPHVRSDLLRWLGTANLAGLALATFAILGVLIAASTALSARLYARRDL